MTLVSVFLQELNTVTYHESTFLKVYLNGSSNIFINMNNLFLFLGIDSKWLYPIAVLVVAVIGGVLVYFKEQSDKKG